MQKMGGEKKKTFSKSLKKCCFFLLVGLTVLLELRLLHQRPAFCRCRRAGIPDDAINEGGVADVDYQDGGWDTLDCR